MEDAGSKRYNIEKIIFDMDGVITSEKGYWYSAAMTVYEKVFEELNISWCEDNVDILAEEIFVGDSVVVNLKNLGINSNIDLAYIIYLAVLIGQAEGFEDDGLWQFVNEYFEDILIEAPELYDYVANEAQVLYNYDDEYIKRNGILWQEIESLFQHWYLGDEIFKEIYKTAPPGIQGKTGFVNFETPIVDLAELKELFDILKEKGYILGIATGRNYYEISTPLKKWDILKYFDKNSIATYDTVEEGEKNLNNGVWLTKPHPYIFLKAAFPGYEDEKVLLKKADDNSRILAVGDAGADIIAAKSANMTFAAVLTGVAGKDAYDYFKGMDADIIINNVLELKDYL